MGAHDHPDEWIGIDRAAILGPGGLGRFRRARALVFLIEQEAARQRDRTSLIRSTALAAPDAVMGPVDLFTGSEETMRGRLPGEADDAFIASFRSARRISAPAAIKDLERSVSAWKPLIPEAPVLRAEVLHQLSLRYVLQQNKTKAIAAAFGVGSSGFELAYQLVAGSGSSAAFEEKKRWFSSKGG